MDKKPKLQTLTADFLAWKVWQIWLVKPFRCYAFQSSIHSNTMLQYTIILDGIPFLAYGNG